MARSRYSVVYFSHLNKTAITWFFARNSGVDLPGYQPCLRLMGAGKSARGNVQDPEQVFKAGIDSIVDVMQKLCSYAFCLSIINKNSLKPSAPSIQYFLDSAMISSLSPLELLIFSPWWIYLLVEIQFLWNCPCTKINDGTHGYCAQQIPHCWQV